MAGIHTPFATQPAHHHRNSYDGTSFSKEQQPNNAARQLSNGFTLDDTFNLPSCPSLDEFLLHATAGFMDSAAHNAAAGGPGGGRHGSGALNRIPSRLLTMSTGKSLSAMASLDLSWLFDGPSGQQELRGRPSSRAQSIARKPSLAEQLVGPEQLGSKELPSVPPLDIKSGFKRPTSASGSLPNKKSSPTKKKKKNSSGKTATESGAAASDPTSSAVPPSPLDASPPSAEAAAYQIQAAQAALLEAQATYLKLLETANAKANESSSKAPLDPVLYEQLVAAQQHLATQQSYFSAALMNAQRFSASPSPSPQQQEFNGTLGASAFLPGYNNNINPYTNGVDTLGMVPLGSNGIPFIAPQQPYPNNDIAMTQNGFMSSTALAPKTPSESRANAMAQWAQERALMQALNSSDMETSVQAFSGILSVAGGGGGGGNDIVLGGGGGGNFIGNGGPYGVPQPLPSSSHSFELNNMFSNTGSGSGAGLHPFASTVTTGVAAPGAGGGGGGSQSAGTPPLNLKISSGVHPMVCLTHAQGPIKVSCTPTSSAPNSPMRVDEK